MKRSVLLILLTVIIPITIFAQACLPEGITFSNQEQVDNFQTDYPGCTMIGGDVTIMGSAVTNLNGLNALITFGGSLIIRGTPSSSVITGLAGLEGVTSISGDLVINYCHLLTDLNGLNSLTSIGGSIEISQNSSLTSLTGLENLTTIGDALEIWSNHALEGLEGLLNLTGIGGTMELWSNYALQNLDGMQNLASIGGSLQLTFNHGLIDLSGLEGLTNIGSNLHLTGNDSLNNLSGLENLVSIGGDLNIGRIVQGSGNPSLTDISALSNLTTIGGDISIYDNLSLTSLSGLENISPSSIVNVYIHYNPSLSSCEALSLCNYLSNPGGTVNIYNNAPGCNNPGEVASSCGIVLDCLPFGNYYFTHQSDVDSFGYHYPDCLELNGNVSICGSDISNLNGMMGVVLIENDLAIGYFDWFGGENPALTSLTGLDSIMSIGGNLSITSNHNMVNVTGLNKLGNIGGYLLVNNDSSLTSLNGLESLESIGGGLNIGGNRSLLNMTGLNTLDSIGGYLHINGNYSLKNLEGLENLKHIGGDFLIGYYHYGNKSLKNLTGLEGLISIGGDLSISGNDSLTSLSGIDNIDANSIDNLYINLNPSLETCQVQSLCDYLASPGGLVQITQNSTGCDDPSDIAGYCGLESLCLPFGNYYFNDQTSIDSFQANYPGCTHLEGLAYIDGNDITNLDGLSILDYIGGNLTIRGNPNLTSLSGLANVHFIDGSLIIGHYEYWGSNPVLSSLTGLENIVYIGGSLGIQRNWILPDLSGLENLSFIGGTIAIESNDAMNSLSGLDNLTHVGGGLIIGDNVSLSSINGLDNLSFIGNDVSIYTNTELLSLAGLENLTYVGGDLSIYGNQDLANISALSNLLSIAGTLDISANNILTSLYGLENINPGSIANLYIQDNNKLSTCEVESICNYLSNPAGIVLIKNNKNGCDSQVEVEEACMVSLDESVVSRQQSVEFIYPNPACSSISIDNSKIPVQYSQLSVYTINSQLVLVQGIAELNNIVDISQLTPGIYIVNLITNDEVLTQKLVVY